MASKKKGRRPRKKNPPKDVAVTDDLGHPLVMNDPDPNGTPHWKYRARASGVWSAADYPTAEKAKMARIRSMRKKPGRRKNPIGVGLKPGKGSKMKAPRKRPAPAAGREPVDLSGDVARLMAVADAVYQGYVLGPPVPKGSPQVARMKALKGATDSLHKKLITPAPKGGRAKVVRTNPKGRKWFPAGRQVINPKGEPARRLELMVDAYSFHSVIEALGVIAAKKAAATRKAQPGLSQMFDDISDHILASTFRLSDIVEREV